MTTRMKLSLVFGLSVFALIPACSATGPREAGEADGRTSSADSIQVCPSPTPTGDAGRSGGISVGGCPTDPRPDPSPRPPPVTCHESRVFNAFLEVGECEDVATRTGTWKATPTFPGGEAGSFCTYRWDSTDESPDMASLGRRVSALGERSNLYPDCTCVGKQCARAFAGKQILALKPGSVGISVNCARCVKGYIHRGLIYVSIPPSFVSTGPSILTSPSHKFELRAPGGQAAFTASVTLPGGGPIADTVVSIDAQGSPAYEDFAQDSSLQEAPPITIQ
jgi:hypothetical protein